MPALGSVRVVRLVCGYAVFFAISVKSVTTGEPSGAGVVEVESDAIDAPTPSRIRTSQSGRSSRVKGSVFARSAITAGSTFPKIFGSWLFGAGFAATAAACVASIK